MTTRASHPPIAPRFTDRRIYEHATDGPPSGGALRIALVPGGIGLLAAAAIALTWTASTPVLDGATRAIAWAAAQDGQTAHLVVTAALATIVALAAAFAWRRAVSPRQPIRLPDGSGFIAVDDLAARVAEVVVERPDVRAVTVWVLNRRRHGVEASLDVEVSPNARLQETSAGITARVQSVIQTQAGLALAQTPQIRIRFEELRLHGQRGSTG